MHNVTGANLVEYDEKKEQIKYDLRTLVEAGQITKDKKRYAAAMKLAKEERKALAELGGMKKE